MGEFSPLPPLAVGMLGMLVLVLALSLGVLPVTDRTIMSSIVVIMLLVGVLTFASIASAESEACKFESGES